MPRPTGMRVGKQDGRNGFSKLISAGLMSWKEAKALVGASGCSWGE